MHWRRKWQPTPVFLPGQSQGRGSLVAAVYGVTQSRTRLKWFSNNNWVSDCFIDSMRATLFFLFLKIFNWRLNTLQYCIGFAIHQHESATGVHVFPIRTPLPHPSPYHPSGTFQNTSPKHPVSWIESGLAIHFLYDIIHISMPFSQIILPHPQSPKDCSIHQCLYCCLTYRVIITIFLNSIYMR